MSPEKHGTPAGYADHYRNNTPVCQPCRTAHNLWQRERCRQVAYGRWNPWVDTTPIRAHVKGLQATGMGQRAIAEAAGVSYQVVNALLYSRGGRPPTSKMRPAHAAALLAVKPRPRYIPATGTTRRLQALVFMGYTQRAICAAVGMNLQSLNQVTTGRQLNVEPRTANKIARLYDAWWKTTGPSKRSINLAAKRGWVGPLSWDNIDDPTERPQGMNHPKHRSPSDVDENVVDRLFAGEHVPATRAERELLTARWVAAGRPLNELAHRFGWKPERYLKDVA